MKALKFLSLTLLPVIFCSCLNINSNTNSTQPTFELKNVIFDDTTYDCVILGGGMAGLTASTYMAMAGFNPLVIQGDIPGGLITRSAIVENWPGEIKISGQELANKLQNQALSHGVNIFKGISTGADFTKWPYTIYVKNLENQIVTEIKTLTCIIAMGRTPNLLGVPGETGDDGYFGRGVSTCAICDGNLYQNKPIAIIGGGDSAAKEAVYLSKIAKKIYMIVRGEKLKANFANQNKLKNIPNVEILFETKATKIIGDGQKVTTIEILNTKSKIVKQLPVSCIFLAIGTKPDSDIFKGQIQLDENGYIDLLNFQETSRQGIFAAGDVSNPKFKQAITASGDGAKAALQAIEFLHEIGYQPEPNKTKRSPNQTEIQEKQKPTAKHGQVIDIDSDTTFESIVKKFPIVIADFYGSACIPCQQMHPIFQQTADHFGNDVKFLKVNVERNGPLNKKYSITSVPTFIIFKNGKQIKKFVGTRTLETLKQELQNVIDSE